MLEESNKQVAALKKKLTKKKKPVPDLSEDHEEHNVSSLAQLTLKEINGMRCITWW